LDFFGKLIDTGLGGVPGVAWKSTPARTKKRMRTWFDDRNPFNEISANHDLIRAVRVSWIEAALEILAAARRQAEVPEWAGDRKAIQTFEKLARTELINHRTATFDCRKDLRPSPIDGHIHAIMEGVPKYIASGDAADGADLTADFTDVLAAISGWPKEEVPGIFQQLADHGLPTHGTGHAREFAELVFAAFADLIKSPDKYPEARHGFNTAMAQSAKVLSETIFAAVTAVDEKLGEVLARLDALTVMQEGAGKYLELLPDIAAGVERLEIKMDDVLAAIAKEKGVDPEHLRPILERLGHTDIPISDIAPTFEQAVDDLMARAGMLSEIHNDGPAIDEAIRAAREKLATADTVGAIAVLDAALDEDETYQRALQAEDEARRNRRQMGRARARAYFEKSYIQRTSFDHEGAIVSLKLGLQLDPDDFWQWVELGDEYVTVGNTVDSLGTFNTAREAAIRNGDDRDLSVSLSRIGDVQVDQGDLDAALKSYQDSLVIVEQLAKSDPGNAGWQRDLSVSLEKIGNVQVDQGDLDAALKSYQDSLVIREQLAKSDPGNAGWQRDLSVSLGMIGNVQVDQGDLDAALKSYQDSLVIREQLAKSDPGNAGWQRDLSVSLHKIGDVQVAQGDLDAVLKSFQDSLVIVEQLAKSDPGNAGWQRDLSVSLIKIGDVQVAQGDLDTALKSYQDSLVIAEQLAKSDPGNAGWQRDLSVSFEKIGDLEGRLENIAGAIAAYEKSLPIAQALADRFPTHTQFQKDIEITKRRLSELRAQSD